MIQISVDRDERVFVRWAEGGPWTVLDRDGQVSTETSDVTCTPWAARAFESRVYTGQARRESA